MSSQIRNNPLLAVIDELLRLQSCFETLFVDVSDASELSTLQKLVLFSVFDAPSPPTVPQVGRNLGHPRQVIQRIANELAEAGLLEKVPNPHHKRAMLLVPTAKANAMKRQAEQRALATAEAFLGTVSKARCTALASELGALRKAIEDFTGDDGGRQAAPADQEPAIAKALTMLERLG